MADFNKLITAIDLETTGLKTGYHEIVSISCRSFTTDFKIETEFSRKIKPNHLNRIDDESLQVNNFTVNELLTFQPSNVIRGDFCVWCEHALRGVKIVPLAHNWSFDKGFLELWLGKELYDKLFHYGNYFDTNVLFNTLVFKGKLEPGSSSLSDLCDRFDIAYKSHNSDHDASATIRLFKKLLEYV